MFFSRRRRHTRWNCDWSSDVCSSDLKNTPGQAAAVIPDAASDMRLEREGRNRWLVVKAEPDALWPKVRQFVLSNGLLISRENAQTGVIETDWAENRAK